MGVNLIIECGLYSHKMCEFIHILDSNTGLMAIYCSVNIANTEPNSTDSNIPQHCNGAIVGGRYLTF